MRFGTFEKRASQRQYFTGRFYAILFGSEGVLVVFVIKMNHNSPTNRSYQSLSFPQACAERLGIWQEGCLTDVLCACAMW